MSKIFICGDTHADIDFHKLNTHNFPFGITLTREDYVIICGDFGGVWGNEKQDKYIQKWYENKPWTTLFVDGNHENHDLLNSYPVSEWNGGKVHFIQPHLIHLMRGQVFNIDGKTFFTMGGASSIDRAYRTEGKSWWPAEMPSREEYDEAVSNLDAVDAKVDYIISHDCDSETLFQINSNYEGNELTQFLYHIKYNPYNLEYKHHYFGHYHIDKDITDKDTCLYNKIIQLDNPDVYWGQFERRIK